MNFRLAVVRLAICIRFAIQHPQRIIMTPLPALLINVRLLWARLMGKRIFVWYVDHKEYLPFVEPTWQRLPADLREDVEIVVVARPESVKEVRSITSDWSPAPSLVITSWVCSLLVCYDLFLTTHPTAIAPLVRSGKRVCTFHGLPAKGGAFSPKQWNFLDGAFLLGPMHEELFEELRRSSSRYARLQGWRIGYPKSDSLVNRSIDARRVARELNLSYDQSLLFAPTWEEHGLLRSDGVPLLTQLCEWGEKSRVNIIVKLHPMSYFPCDNELATGGKDWNRELKRFESFACFRMVSGGDLTPLLAVANLMLSDFSSACLEAVLADCPIVLVDTPKLIQEVLPRLHGVASDVLLSDPRHNCGRDAATIVADRHCLLEQLERTLAAPSDRSERRAELRDRLLFNPGTSSDVAVRWIMNSLTSSRRKIRRATPSPMLDGQSFSGEVSRPNEEFVLRPTDCRMKSWSDLGECK